MQKRQPHAFTLIELLVVVAIIAILAAMLLPALTKARTRSRISVCQGDRRQLYMAIFMYTDDFGGELPNVGQTNDDYRANAWPDARFHSEQELQNWHGTIKPPHRYWGLGMLWPGGYMGEGDTEKSGRGQFLYCADTDIRRLTNASTRVSSVLAWKSPGSGMAFVMDDGTYRLDSSSKGRFHPTTTFVSTWYLSQNTAPTSIRQPFGEAKRLDAREPSTPLVNCRAFEANDDWEQTVPHGNMGIVRVGGDGRIGFLNNPWANAVVGFNAWGGHPWSQGSGG